MSDPHALHDLQVLLFPTKGISDLDRVIHSKVEDGHVAVLAAVYLDTSGDVPQWHYSWAASEDLKLPLTVVKGAVASLSHAIHASTSSFEGTGTELRDFPPG